MLGSISSSMSMLNGNGKRVERIDGVFLPYDLRFEVSTCYLLQLPYPNSGIAEAFRDIMGQYPMQIA